MIIIGDKYKIEEYEYSILAKKFKDITFLKDIKPTDSSDDDVLDQGFIDRINHIVSNNKKVYKKKILILNFDYKASYKVIDSLVTLDLKGAEFYTFAQFYEKFLHKCWLPAEEEYDKLDYLTDFKHPSLTQKIYKLSLSFLAVFVISILALPVGLLFAILIKMDSPGPIFFKQKRVGLNGSKYICLKFRSMYHGRKEEGDLTTSKNDERVTRIGKIMRQLRIDELPQLVNIIKGDLYLIGPRTEWDILVDKYKKAIPYYNLRHIVKPGITGWAQVCYPYGTNNYDARQKLMYDLYYIKNWTIWLELRIYLYSIYTVIAQKGQ